MNDERVIDGVMHRLEGKIYVPLTAAELTARLLEARRIMDEQRIRVVPFEVPTAPPPSIPYYPTWPRPLWEPPFWVRDRTGDQMPPAWTITSAAQ